MSTTVAGSEIEIGCLVRWKRKYSADDGHRYRVLGEVFWGLGEDDPPNRQLYLYNIHSDEMIGEISASNLERVEE